LPYHNIAAEKYRRLNWPYALSETRPPSEEHMQEIAHLLRAYGLKIR
jgi:pyruvate formate lyase activating enzyme